MLIQYFVLVYVGDNNSFITVMFRVILLLLLTFNWRSAVSVAKSESQRTFFSSTKLTDDNMLKVNHIASVTKLVTEAFKKISHVNNGMPSMANKLFTGILRIFGFDSKSIEAIAVNGLIFLAQLLATFLMRKSISQIPESKNMNGLDSENQFEWILENNEIVKTISNITDRNLPKYIIEYIKEKSSDKESGCIQLLICKVSPFIWAMQDALNTTDDVSKNKESVLFRHLPEAVRLQKQSDICEKSYQSCNGLPREET